MHPEDTDLFSEMDLQFARFMAKISSRPHDALSLAAAMVSRATGNGHVCLDLKAVAGQPLDLEGDHGNGFVCPGLSPWVKSLRSSGVVGLPGDEMPLILDENHRLYLFRYWEYEFLLAKRINDLVKTSDNYGDEVLLKKGLGGFFDGADRPGPDWQEVACFAGATRRLCVVSGGPGTGKSTVVSRILALIALQQVENPPQMALVAPTGKAAQRLQEAVRTAVEDPRFPESVREKIPLEASTIHRLLTGVFPIATPGSFPHGTGRSQAGIFPGDRALLSRTLLSAWKRIIVSERKAASRASARP